MEHILREWQGDPFESFHFHDLCVRWSHHGAKGLKPSAFFAAIDLFILGNQILRLLCCPNNKILLATNRRGEYRVLPCDADRGPLFPFQPEPATIFAAAEDCKVLCK